jgi:hypothetical protein
VTAANPTARTALLRILSNTATDFLDATFGPEREAGDIADALLTVHLSEVVPSTRAEALNEATDALTARAGELSHMAEEELRRDLEEEAQVWHEAADVVRKLTGAGQTGAGATQPADFFQPGHGYTHRSYGNDFHCVTVTTHPITGERLAMGWLSEHGEWHRPTVVGINQWNHEYDGVEPPTGGDAQ